MGCGDSCSTSSSKMALKAEQKCGHIDTNALAILIATKTPMLLFDARTSKWDDGKRIASAKSLTSECTKEEAAKLIPNKHSLIITYCSNPQCPASNLLAERLLSFGYSHILEYPEGIKGWIDAGHPVHKS